MGRGSVRGCQVTMGPIQGAFLASLVGGELQAPMAAPSQCTRGILFSSHCLWSRLFPFWKLP